MRTLGIYRVSAAAAGAGVALGDAVINNAGKPKPSSLGVDTYRQNELLSSSNGTLAKLVQDAYVRQVLVLSEQNVIAGLKLLVLSRSLSFFLFESSGTC